MADNTFNKLYTHARCEQYTGVSAEELLEVKSLFERALRHDRLDASSYQQKWLALGFDWISVDKEGKRWWVARERITNCRGQGFYAFNAEPKGKTMLQVPHRFKDANTGRIASKWFDDDSLAVIAWNTVARNTLDKKRKQKGDFAHRWDNYFVALTQAYSEVYPTGLVIQLHGFSNAKRRTDRARNALIIVSAGHAWPGKQARRIHSCLRGFFGDAVRLYPDEVHELGATKNVQGKLLRSLGHNGFVHVELSNKLRARMLKNADEVSAIGSCLGGMK